MVGTWKERGSTLKVVGGVGLDLETSVGWGSTPGLAPALLSQLLSFSFFMYILLNG